MSTSANASSFSVFGSTRGTTDAAYGAKLDEAAAQAAVAQARAKVTTAFLACENAETTDLRSIRAELPEPGKKQVMRFALLTGKGGKLLAFAQFVGSYAPTVWRCTKLDPALDEALGYPAHKPRSYIANFGQLREAAAVAGVLDENALLDRVSLTSTQQLFLRKLIAIGGQAALDDKRLLALPLHHSLREQAFGGLLDRRLIDASAYPTIAVNAAGRRVMARYDAS